MFRRRIGGGNVRIFHTGFSQIQHKHLILLGKLSLGVTVQHGAGAVAGAPRMESLRYQWISSRIGACGSGIL